MTRKGIILAGGAGTRLHPLTLATSKQLLPVYDKPMVYYPISVLMRAGIRDILIITTPEDQAAFKRLLGDGARIGVNFSYIVQDRPEGLAQAYLLGEDFLDGAPSAMALGDNLFFGDGLGAKLASAGQRTDGATVFGAWVKEPHRYGVVDFDADQRAVRIVEKPSEPPSNYAVTGLYFYDGDAPELARQVRPSARGELEITDLNNLYLERGALNVELLGQSFVWLDAGTHESLLEASEFVRVLEERHNRVIGCIEEIAYDQGWIDAEALRQIAGEYAKSPYGQYLAAAADRPPRGTPPAGGAAAAPSGPRLVAGR